MAELLDDAVMMGGRGDETNVGPEPSRQPETPVRDQNVHAGTPPAVSHGRDSSQTQQSPASSSILSRLLSPISGLVVIKSSRGMKSPDAGDGGDDPSDDELETDEDKNPFRWWVLVAFLLITPITYFLVPQAFRIHVIVAGIIQITTVFFMLVLTMGLPPVPMVIRRRKKYLLFGILILILLGLIATYNVGGVTTGPRSLVGKSISSDACNSNSETCPSINIIDLTESDTEDDTTVAFGEKMNRKKQEKMKCRREDYRSRRDISFFSWLKKSPLKLYYNGPGSEKYKQIISKAAEDMVKAISVNSENWSYLYDPTGELPVSELLPIGLSEQTIATPSKYWSNLLHQMAPVVYAFVVRDDDSVDYIGYSSNHTQRQEYWVEKKGKKFFETKVIPVVLVHLERLPLSLNKACIKIWKKMMKKLTKIDDLPESLKNWLRDSYNLYHHGGMKREDIFMLIEYGLQQIYGVSDRGEAWMYDTKKEEKMTNAASTLGDTLCENQRQLWGDDILVDPETIEHIGTWRPGHIASRLTSFETAIRYITGLFKYYDTIDKPIYPNATTEDEIFAKNFTTSQIHAAIKRFIQLVRKFLRNRHTPSIKIVDGQDYIWKDNLVEPQMLLCEEGCHLYQDHAGGEILEFHCDMAILYLIGHPSVACDSREEVSVVPKQLRAITLDALRIARQCATEKPGTYTKRFDAIRGSIRSEIVYRGKHNNRFFSTAVCRDSMSRNFGVDAIEKYGGKLSQKDIDYPFSKTARETFHNYGKREDSTEMLQQTVFDEMSINGIEDTLAKYNQFLHEDLALSEDDRKDRRAIPKHWEKIENWFAAAGPSLQGQVREEIEKYMLKKRREDPRKSVARSDYDEIVKMMNSHADKNGSAVGMRFLVVRKDQTYKGDTLSGYPVLHRIFEESTSKKPNLTNLLKMAFKSRQEQLVEPNVAFKIYHPSGDKKTLLNIFSGGLPKELALVEVISMEVPT